MQADLMNLKKFTSREYSFGVSRKASYKVHVDRVYWESKMGWTNPGPGTYTPKPLMGSETPRFSFLVKNN
jgi:hypothetical protein